ncbi:MAG: hypothetical protein NZ699_14275 [Roseiflexus sp.]|nr:hypothetical protein [Roseiflexus sp.]MCS7290293.1 hypothetical protein [Roseiflexus sp.]MDW8231291.1 hypothetical protein [Roseiflexaceae bacterium]
MRIRPLPGESMRLRGIVVVPYFGSNPHLRDIVERNADVIIVPSGEAYSPNRTICALEPHHRNRAPVVAFAGSALPGRSSETSSA